MKLQLKKASTSNILQVFIADSSSTTGAGLTGLTQASSGLTAYYHRDTDTTATAITLVTMTVGTFTSSGIKEIDSTNMPGWYQFCPPNAAVATGASNVGFHLKGATNMAPLPIEVQLVSYDPYDAVALGLTNLDTTVSSRSSYSGGAVASVTGNVGGNVVGSVGSVTGAVGSVTGAVGSVTGNVGGNVVGSTASVTGSVGSVAGNVGGNVAGSVGSVTGAVGSVSSSVTVGTNNDKSGYTISNGQLTVKKNTALSAFTFPMFDSTNHQLVTGLSVTAQRSIDGGSVATCTNSVVEVGVGLYKIDLTASELNGTIIALRFSATAADDLPYTIITQS